MRIIAVACSDNQMSEETRLQKQRESQRKMEDLASSIKVNALTYFVCFEESFD